MLEPDGRAALLLASQFLSKETLFAQGVKRKVTRNYDAVSSLAVGFRTGDSFMIFRPETDGPPPNERSALHLSTTVFWVHYLADKFKLKSDGTTLLLTFVVRGLLLLTYFALKK